MVQCQVLCRLLDKKHSENGRFSGGPAYGSLRSYMPMVTVLKLNSLGKKRFPDSNEKKKKKKRKKETHQEGMLRN